MTTLQQVGQKRTGGNPSKSLDTIDKRLRHWRMQVADLTLDEVHQAVNEHVERRPYSRSSVNNYESPRGKKEVRGSIPPADFLAALQRAFPDLSMDWLLLGEGDPRRSADANRHEFHDRMAAGVQEERDSGDVSGYEIALALALHDVPFGVDAANTQQIESLGPDAIRELAGLAREAVPYRSWRGPTEAEQGQRAGFFEILARIAAAPFEAPEPFIDSGDLSSAEAHTYALALVTTLRPLVRPLRQFGTIPPTPEQAAVNESKRDSTPNAHLNSDPKRKED